MRAVLQRVLLRRRRPASQASHQAGDSAEGDGHRVRAEDQRHQHQHQPEVSPSSPGRLHQAVPGGGVKEPQLES